MDAQEALKALFEQGGVTLKDGREVKIHKISMETFGPALALVTKVADGLGLDVAKGIDTAELADNPVGLLKLISNHYADTLALASTLTDMSLPDLKKLEADDGIKVVHGVYAINHDFFTNQVLPALKNAIAVSGKKNAAS